MAESWLKIHIYSRQCQTVRFLFKLCSKVLKKVWRIYSYMTVSTRLNER